MTVFHSSHCCLSKKFGHFIFPFLKEEQNCGISYFPVYYDDPLQHQPKLFWQGFLFCFSFSFTVRYIQIFLWNLLSVCLICSKVTNFIFSALNFFFDPVQPKRVPKKAAAMQQLLKTKAVSNTDNVLAPEEM